MKGEAKKVLEVNIAGYFHNLEVGQGLTYTIQDKKQISFRPSCGHMLHYLFLKSTQVFCKIGGFAKDRFSAPALGDSVRSSSSMHRLAVLEL